MYNSRKPVSVNVSFLGDRNGIKVGESCPLCHGASPFNAGKTSGAEGKRFNVALEPLLGVREEKSPSPRRPSKAVGYTGYHFGPDNTRVVKTSQLFSRPLTGFM